mgnify:FL=1
MLPYHYYLHKTRRAELRFVMVIKCFCEGLLVVVEQFPACWIHNDSYFAGSYSAPTSTTMSHLERMSSFRVRTIAMIKGSRKRHHNHGRRPMSEEARWQGPHRSEMLRCVFRWHALHQEARPGTLFPNRPIGWLLLHGEDISLFG